MAGEPAQLGHQIVARGGEAEAAAAVAAAQDAFPGWSRTSPGERAEVLHRIADGIEARSEELAQVETRDNGSLLHSHRRGVMPRVAMNFRYFAGHLLKLHHDDFGTRGHRNHLTWDPAGVTAVITPWNAPLMLATWRIAPALAAAGLPEGVLNVVQGLGTEAGAPLVAHPGVRRISFTGSAPTAQRIAASAAANVTPVSFELGGNSPLLIFDDADLDLAVDLAAEQFDNAGQVCLAAVRILVQDGIAAEFRSRFLAKVSPPPWPPGTRRAPVASPPGCRPAPSG